MDKIPAGTGWHWIKDGFRLFAKQPVELTTLFLSYLFLMVVIGVIPALGQVLPLILVPVFSMTFMHACSNVEQGKRVLPTLLFIGFKQPQLVSLLLLGFLYLLSAVLAVGASSLVDGGLFLKLMTSQISPEQSNVKNADLSLAMLFAATIFIPFNMAFWYAAPLIAWQNMRLGKALFYSFFAVRRAGRAFLVFGLGWAAIGVFLPALISAAMSVFIGRATIAVVVLLPLSIMLTVVMYCSFYPTYTYIFHNKSNPSPPEN